MKILKSHLRRNKKYYLSAVMLLMATAGYSQFNESAGGELVDKIQDIGRVIYKIIYGVAALGGIAGGIAVAYAYWSNKQDAGDMFKKLIIGFIIVVALGGIIHLFTGINFE